MLRELRAAQKGDKDVILVHERDELHGGVHKLEELAAECPEDLRAFVFNQSDGAPRPVIVWHRYHECVRIPPSLDSPGRLSCQASRVWVGVLTGVLIGVLIGVLSGVLIGGPHG